MGVLPSVVAVGLAGAVGASGAMGAVPPSREAGQALGDRAGCRGAAVCGCEPLAGTQVPPPPSPARASAATIRPVVRRFRTTHSFSASLAEGTVDRVLAAAWSRRFVIHLREASPGTPVSLVATQPLLTGDVALAHNGFCSPIAKLRGILASAQSDQGRSKRAVTDSAILLSLADHFIQLGHQDPLQMLADMVGPAFPAVSLNTALLTPSSIHILSHFPETDSNHDSETSETEYHRLYQEEGEDGCRLVASSGVLSVDAEPLVNHVALRMQEVANPGCRRKSEIEGHSGPRLRIYSAFPRRAGLYRLISMSSMWSTISSRRIAIDSFGFPAACWVIA